MKKDAYISKCGRFRYALWRSWQESPKSVMFIGLNPSYADAEKDDRTVTSCIGYATSWGYGGLIMANLFAFRSTDPGALWEAEDPIGQENDRWLLRLSHTTDMTVAAWGNDGAFLTRDQAVRRLIPDMYCLKLTMQGQPHHTRGLSAALKPIPMSEQSPPPYGSPAAGSLERK